MLKGILELFQSENRKQQASCRWHHKFVHSIFLKFHCQQKRVLIFRIKGILFEENTFLDRNEQWKFTFWKKKLFDRNAICICKHKMKKTWQNVSTSWPSPPLQKRRSVKRWAFFMSLWYSTFCLIVVASSCFPSWTPVFLSFAFTHSPYPSKCTQDVTCPAFFLSDKCLQKKQQKWYLLVQVV